MINNIFNLIINLTAEEINHINIDNKIYELSCNVGNPRNYFYMDCGKEHYKLLIAISFLFNNSTFIDIGSHLGESAIALASNPTNSVISFDIVDTYKSYIDKIKDDGRFENIKFMKEDVLLWKSSLLQSPFIMLDTYHDGIFEEEFIKFLSDVDYQGIVLLDDIHLNCQMENFWTNIKQHKVDISRIGHHSGTGIVLFNSLTEKQE